MSTITMSFRATNEDRNYLTGLDVPLTQLMRDLIVSLKRGKITYGTDGFSGKEPVGNEPIEDKEPTKEDELDLSALYEIAKKRRITPQSLLDNALRPYGR